MREIRVLTVRCHPVTGVFERRTAGLGAGWFLVLETRVAPSSASGSLVPLELAVGAGHAL